MEMHLDPIQIVLYQPEDVVNVASIIRVMSNFGLPHLRLVEPAAFDPYRIEGIAHHTEKLVAATRHFGTLDEAVADCSLVFGTTGRPRRTQRPVLTPRAAAPVLLEAARAGRRVAVLFGPEEDGLPNTALDRCHGIITIPTHPDNRSLNLAQAALVVAYELWMAASQGEADAALTSKPLPVEDWDDLADGDSREAMFAALEAMLRSLYPGTTEERLAGAMQRLRAMLMRAAPRQAEARAFTNLCRHAARALGNALEQGNRQPQA